MKKTLIIFSAITMLAFYTSCGGKGEKKADVKVSTEMQDFMNNLNGRAASVKIALDDFGVPGIDRKDMDMYDLAKPEVLEAKDNCYLMRATSGMTKRSYNLCWKDGKIVSVEDKGME
ncbi:MAG: hypothetical protein JNM88_16895 [Chitinophagaceae bacterium]|nr:hypothetical protein [Chitinophagaceae bacterium]